MVSFIDNRLRKSACLIGCLEASSRINFFRSTDVYKQEIISLYVILSMVFAIFSPRSSREREYVWEVAFQAVLGFAIENTPFLPAFLSQISKFYPAILAFVPAK